MWFPVSRKHAQRLYFVLTIILSTHMAIFGRSLPSLNMKKRDFRGYAVDVRSPPHRQSSEMCVCVRVYVFYEYLLWLRENNLLNLAPIANPTQNHTPGGDIPHFEKH